MSQCKYFTISVVTISIHIDSTNVAPQREIERERERDRERVIKDRGKLISLGQLLNLKYFLGELLMKAGRSCLLGKIR